MDDLFASLLPFQSSGTGSARRERTRERNQLIVLRYWWMGEVLHLRYSFVAERLSKEFFLSDRRIFDIVYSPAQVSYLKQLRQDPPSLEELKKRYPLMSWSFPKAHPYS